MSDGDAFLVEFHRRHTGATSRAFADGRTADGHSSYDLLVARCPPAATAILDLGCGDGHLLELLRAHRPQAALFGIDFSPDEIGRARQRLARSEVALVTADARATPFDDGAMDVVVSHLAFMLMSEVEEVVAEIARVLRPGGAFATIVGGGPRASGDAFELFLEELLPLVRRSGRLIPALGDRRTRRDDGIAALLSRESGFGDLSVDDFYVSLDGPVESVWDKLRRVYETAALDPRELAVLEHRFCDRARSRWGDSEIPCTMAVRRVCATRATRVMTR